jgi:hypothetical protein
VPARDYRNLSAGGFHFRHQRRFLLQRPLPAALNPRNDLTVHFRNPSVRPEGFTFAHTVCADHQLNVGSDRTLTGQEQFE